MIALLLAVTALALSALLRDVQLALTSALAAAIYLYTRLAYRGAQHIALHVSINAMATAALEATRPALGDLFGVATIAVSAYTIYVAYVTYSYVLREVVRIRKKYRFRERR
jgi:hypothetical protein